ncbi:MAG: geranylgeranylglycerol-phosphate geranylgeranyltransferase [Flavobacteriales bacterium]|nr:geranylgeranylglycerol-phosphate geranylgeranyltransferase [Flavobacteriales bacterium]
MKDLLKLTRPTNLLIIAATMLLMRYGVIGGHLERGLQQLCSDVADVQRSTLILPPGFGPQMPLVLFLLLVLSTILIAAGGNVINDYFDTRIDRINKPGQVIVGRTVRRRVAMTAHAVLSGLGLLLGVIVAWRTGLFKWATIPAFAIGALWVYSTTFKRRLIIGNGLVATLTALVPLTVGLYELPLLQRAMDPAWVVELPNGDRYEMQPFHIELWYWILGFAAFAFLSTLVRELQKDMADVKGDAADGCRTLPIVWGMKWARIIALIHIAVIIGLLLFVRSQLLRDPFSYWYIGIGVIGPLLLSAGFTYQAQHREEFIRAGNTMKVAMVMAIGYAVLIRFLP